MEENKKQEATVLEDIRLTEDLSVIKLSDGKVRIIESSIESYLADSLDEAITIFKTQYSDQLSKPLSSETLDWISEQAFRRIKYTKADVRNPDERRATVTLDNIMTIDLTRREDSLDYRIRIGVPPIWVNGQIVASLDSHYEITDAKLVKDAFAKNQIAELVVTGIIRNDICRAYLQFLHHTASILASHAALLNYANKSKK